MKFYKAKHDGVSLDKFILDRYTFYKDELFTPGELRRFHLSKKDFDVIEADIGDTCIYKDRRVLKR